VTDLVCATNAVGSQDGLAAIDNARELGLVGGICLCAVDLHLRLCLEKVNGTLDNGAWNA
jgi:hypothetical protein